MAGQLDLSMDSMEETRFKKRNQYLIQRLEKRLHFTYAEIECLLLIYYKLWKEGLVNNPAQVRMQKKKEHIIQTNSMPQENICDILGRSNQSAI